MGSALFMFSVLIQIIFLPLCTIGQHTSPIQVGTTLTTSNSSTWQSPSGEFTLGFRQVNDASYLLSIWYTKIPDTLLWYAGPDWVLAPEGSVLTCDANRGLDINDPHGTNLYNLASFGGKTSYCVLDDTGNLFTRSKEGNINWQSFDHPRDTLLPSQNLSSGGAKLYSRFSRTNFTRGKFQLQMLSDGNLILNTRSLVTDFTYDGYYYTSDTSDPNNASNSGNMVNYDVSGHMYILRKNGSQQDLLQGNSVPSPDDYYFRATLNYDGVFAWYYHSKNITNGSSSWIIIDWLPTNDICSSKTGEMDGGICGYNSICKSDTGGDYPRPTCECPPRYSFVDPNDTFGACKPDFKLPTYNEEIGYKLEKLPMTNWPMRDYDELPQFSEDQCMNSCLSDFLCVAVIFGGTTCWKKAFPLINGRIDTTATAYLKVSDVNDSQVVVPPSPSPCLRGDMNPLVPTLMGASLFVNLLLVCTVLGIWFFCRTEHKASPSLVSLSVERWNTIRCFAYKDLEKATKGFQEELGRGACAIVYKGIVDGCQSLVAVKKMDRALLREVDKEFKTEVSVIGKTHHKNLVRLVGFCHEEDHRMLVYEFMRSGSLADFLFGETRPSWLSRVQIAQGIARGLVYLHEECDTQIIHCDIKPQNILLDDCFEAHISDFGLSKLLMVNQFQTHTAVRGTKGYVAPEWFRSKPVTTKVDVYSFGVVLLEIVSCRRCIDLESSEEEKVILIDWAFDCYQEEDLSALVENDMEALGDKMRLEKFIKVALWCIQEDPNLRPTMRQVSLMLEGVSEVSAPPGLGGDFQSVSIIGDC